jgi:Protein of unknown function (DUF998)
MLYCGVLGSLLWVATDQLAGRLLSGYDFVSRSISELSASGTPTRLLVISLDALATALLIVFGVGAWRLAGQAVLPRITAALLIGQVVATFVAEAAFPATNGARPGATSAGVIVGALSIVLLLLTIGFGAAAFGGWFRLLSLGVLAGYALLAALRFTVIPQSASLVGVQERTMQYVFLMWVVMLAMFSPMSTEA